MKKISDRNELNQYYSLVNAKMDEYFTKYKIRPNEFLSYLKNNLDEVKEEFGVSDVIGIEKVIMDVCRHYLHSQEDNILKFESFRLKL